MTEERTRTARHYNLSRLWKAKFARVCLCFLTVSFVAKAQVVPPGVIVFSHEESGSSDRLQRYSNLYAIDAQNPGQPVPLTAFTQPSTLAATPVWSKDYSRLAFASNFNNGISSLEEYSIYSLNPDGTNVQRITGFGVLNPFPPPTGTVIGHVQAPPVLGGGQVDGCVISVQGAPQSVACGDDDGGGRTFTITDVPVASAWVRVQAEVSYTETPGDPGLSLGFAAISVMPDGVTDAGTIFLYPQIPRSIEPAWSADGTRLVTSNEAIGKRLRINPTTRRYEWVPSDSHELRVWSADGQFVRAIPNPPGLQSFGSDWSPTDDRIAFAAIGSSAFESYIYLADPDGGNAQRIYSVPFQLYSLPFVTFCRWSPDGQRIAFIQLSEPGLGGPWWADLYVINRDGTNLQQLTGNVNSPGGFSNVPTWSPDGQALAFEFSVNRSNPPALVPESVNLFVVDLNNPRSGFVQLTSDGRSSNPTWGPN
jgi:Tol biopolymer transport system component